MILVFIEFFFLMGMIFRERNLKGNDKKTIFTTQTSISERLSKTLRSQKF